jgi:hypothetical protein
LLFEKNVDSRHQRCITPTVTTGVALAAMVGLAAVFEARAAASGETHPDVLIRRVVEQSSRMNLTVRGERDMRAGTVNGKHLGWMKVETTRLPGGEFSWRVVEEGGSERTRNKVLRALLDGEVETTRAGLTEAAIHPANYAFSPAGTDQLGNPQIRLTPRRADPALVHGILTVRSDGSPVRLEGKLAKSPSFWVKSVTIVKHYDRFVGVTLPTSVESLADLKMFGRATLTMRYRYSEVNGARVFHSVTAAPFVGPTAEILALHSSGTEQ